MGINSNQIILFHDKKDCCGCGACMNICQIGAIIMKEDEYGFQYPLIEHEKCVRCGMCKNVCAYQNKSEANKVVSTWVAAAKDDEIIKKSASGGIFAAIALEVIKKENGVVFGCAFEKVEGKLVPKHIKVTKVEDLVKLQGSKYVQSIIGDTYNEVKQELMSGKFVLFSGTPCQVAALRSFLGKEYEKLLMIDIICHGVPSVKLFQDYVKLLGKKLKGTIIDFKFRDKSKGWGYKVKVEYFDSRSKAKFKFFPPALSSYFMMFLKSEIIRENCYSCRYACEQRVGDLTIGDYWGIKKEHPEYLRDGGGTFDERKGISCILVNTMTGKKTLSGMGYGIQLQPSTFQKAAAMNGQLKEPSPKSNVREKILSMYAADGYVAVEKWYNKRLGIKKYAYILWNIIPMAGQEMVKKFLKR